ncbi:hypothetical protein OQJ15_13760 [Fluoribacter dumoffii]|uniref:hypothetical protein n=1 Tax=Fluoribacter dumoffii TaxID=463 RepID=UPI002243469B|nr:hypothetical protein [Fluoribacter dumoffii]MCW8387371.1 hypothetical protein [Fluoribacter dumoffii]MCW8497575.1 hypothetical protein [Fluoribacter dumoffii]
MRSILSLRSSALSQTILREINPAQQVGKYGSIFSSPKTSMQIPKTIEVPVHRENAGFKQLLGSLISDEDIVHRGMASFSELNSIALHGKLGGGDYAKRPASLNIAEFIENPKSSLLLSTSPDPHTVKEYMIGFQLIRAKGAITSMGLPFVFIRPQIASHIDVEQFNYQQNIIEEDLKLGNRTRSEDIFDLAQGNNETTVVLGATPEDDWHPTHRHLHTLKLVKNASGRILQGFMRTEGETFDIVTITNPEFCKSLMSLQLFTTAFGKGEKFLEYLERMNKRAQELGLITGEQRILTMEDVCVLMRSPQYRETLETFTTTGQTKVLEGIPSDIPVGDPKKLLEYAVHVMDSIPEKMPIPEALSESTLHLKS